MKIKKWNLGIACDDNPEEVWIEEEEDDDGEWMKASDVERELPEEWTKFKGFVTLEAFDKLAEDNDRLRDRVTALELVLKQVRDACDTMIEVDARIRPGPGIMTGCARSILNILNGYIF